MHTLVLNLASSHLKENDLFNSAPFTVDLLEQLPNRTRQQAEPKRNRRRRLRVHLSAAVTHGTISNSFPPHTQIQTPFCSRCCCQTIIKLILMMTYDQHHNPFQQNLIFSSLIFLPNWTKYQIKNTLNPACGARKTESSHPVKSWSGSNQVRPGADLTRLELERS